MKNIKNNINPSLDDVLMAFRHRMTTSLLEEAKETGFSLSHFEVLGYIAEKEKVTMKDIATWLHITPPSASTLVEVLVEKELVSRLQSDKDRRTIYIILGEKSHKLFQKIHRQKISLFKAMLSKLDDKDKEELARIISKCIPN